MSFLVIKRVKHSLVAVCLFAILQSGVMADQEGEYQQSIDNIGKQINKISQNLNANKALLKTEQDKLSEIEQNVTSMNRQINETSNNIERQHKAGLKLENQIQRLNEIQVQDKEEIALLIRQQYLQGQANYLKMLLNQENPYTVGRLSNYYAYFAKAKSIKLDKVREQITKTQMLESNHQKLIDTLESEQKKQTKQKQGLRTAKQKRQQSVEKLNKKVESSNIKLKRLKQDRERLNSLLKQISIQAERLRHLEQMHEEKNNSQKNRKIIRPLVKGGFLNQKGRLRYPVSGKPKYQFGSRLIESGMRSQGAFFNTTISEPIKTIFRGRVLFADYLKGYGLLMIIDHGDEHISLYGHNEVLYKKVGDRVETNEVVAAAGLTGGLKSSGLYFEIRKGATPVNPAKWCQL